MACGTVESWDILTFQYMQDHKVTEQQGGNKTHGMGDLRRCRKLVSTRKYAETYDSEMDPAAKAPAVKMLRAGIVWGTRWLEKGKVGDQLLIRSSPGR